MPFASQQRPMSESGHFRYSLYRPPPACCALPCSLGPAIVDPGAEEATAAIGEAAAAEATGGTTGDVREHRRAGASGLGAAALTAVAGGMGRGGAARTEGARGPEAEIVAINAGAKAGARAAARAPRAKMTRTARRYPRPTPTPTLPPQAAVTVEAPARPPRRTGGAPRAPTSTRTVTGSTSTRDTKKRRNTKRRRNTRRRKGTGGVTATGRTRTARTDREKKRKPALLRHLRERLNKCFY